MSAIVLGVGPGLGMSLARAYAETGRSVAVVALHQEQADDFARELGGGAVGFAGNLGDSAQVKAVIEAAAERLGPPDIVHYNASLLVEGPPTAVSLDAVESAWRVGCLGAWSALQAAAPLMDEGSAFFATNSGVSIDPWSGGSVLSSAKAALRSFMFSAAQELPQLKIAMITIMGVIKEGTDLSPDEIARNFLALLEERQPPVETLLPRA
ncbi:MAG: SDR family oxidoreductase [Candidatus Nanopelagicales bacterium]|nr:SDR family oxidoreductase [Candidatus Nanopelagicales bacterium]